MFFVENPLKNLKFLKIIRIKILNLGSGLHL
jgi:hypothetical protein